VSDVRRHPHAPGHDAARVITARLHLGLCYYAAGRKDEATAEWRAVLEISPENKSAEMYLAMLESRGGSAPT
jgi:Tfp pilus assembly protein PilF